MLHNVLLVDKKEHWINKKMQMAYKINEANVFTIVCRNFKVTQAGWDRPISRWSYCSFTHCPYRWSSTTKVKSHVNENYSMNDNTRAADIARLCSEGVEVDQGLRPRGDKQASWWEADSLWVLQVVGMHVLHGMLCYVGFSPINLWWSKKEESMFNGAPFRRKNVMSVNRFQAFNKAIRYTKKPVPEGFVDKFHDVRQTSGVSSISLNHCKPQHLQTLGR